MTTSEHIPTPVSSEEFHSARDYLLSIYDQPQYQNFLDFYTTYCRAPRQAPPVRIRNGTITTFPTFLANGVAWDHKEMISLRQSTGWHDMQPDDYDQYLLMKLDIATGQTTEYTIDSIAKVDEAGDLFYYVGDALQLNIVAHDAQLPADTIDLTVSNRGSRYTTSAGRAPESLADIGSMASEVEYDHSCASRHVARRAIAGVIPIR